MESKSLKCPECGGWRDLAKVDPDTYRCPYCEIMFTLVDSRLIRVKIQRDYCLCGNPVEFQCQLCRSGLCEECDVIEWQMGSKTASGRHARKLVVSVRSFGYLGIGGPTKAGTVIDGQITERRVGSPILYVDDILPQLARGRPAGIRHLCCSCLTKGVPETIEAIDSGRVCERPGCGASSRQECPCCGGMFCNRHIVSAPKNSVIEDGSGGYWSNSHLEEQRTIASIEWPIPNRREKVLKGPKIRGLCQMCALERIEEAREEILSICNSFRWIVSISKRRDPSRPVDRDARREFLAQIGITGKGRGHGQVARYKVPDSWWSKAVDDEFPIFHVRYRRANKIINRLVELVRKKNRDLEDSVTLDTCGRDRLADSPGWYTLVDQRRKAARTTV
jgi:hypothetical protein